MAAASDVPLSSFLTDSLTSLLDPCGQGVGPSHASLALLVLLAVDAHLRGLQCLPASPEQLLSSLLLPLASILVSASSRPYLPPHSLTLSLHTLTSLITSFLSGNSLSHTYWSGQLNLVVISLACRPEIPPLLARYIYSVIVILLL
jgi:hypothetical protein